MTNSLPYRYDATAFREVFEQHFTGASHPMLAGDKRPRAYRFVGELPLTATGKKVHYVVREWALRDAHAGPLERP